MSDHEGKIVEFLDSGRLKLGLVTKQVGEKLQVSDSNGKQRRVASKHVVVVHSGTHDPTTFTAAVAQLEEAIGAAQQEIDTELLWESVREELRDYQLEELARSYFGGAGTEQVSAVYRAVSTDGVRFRTRGRTVQPRTPEQVTDQLNSIRKKAEREAFRDGALAWIREALAAEGAVEVPDDIARIVDRLEGYLLQRREDEVESWLEEVRPSASGKQTAFELLSKVGRLPPDADPRLVIAGVRESFSRDVLGEAERLSAVDGAGRVDFTGLTAFSIDDEDTREVDDALTVELDGETTRVGIHIADVASFVERDSPLDREASRRGATIYLPYRTVPMFPERLSCDLASLRDGEVRPTVSFLVDFSASGAVENCEIVRGLVRVAHRLTYDDADRYLAQAGGEGGGGRGRDGGSVPQALRRLDAITQVLLEERRARGALTMRRPELKLIVIRQASGAGNPSASTETISVKVIDPTSTSRRVVSEMMILANALTAQHAESSAVPIIYRAQDPPSEPVSLPREYDPVAVEGVFRKLKRSFFSLHAQKHAGLGLDAYTQLTSPIRRFQDLVMQRQIAAHLAGAPLPYEQQELFEVLGSAQAVENENRALERDAVQEYTLRYLRDERSNAVDEAVVVADVSGTYHVELVGMPIRGRLATAARLEPGERVDVRIREVVPERGVLFFERARKAES